MVQAREGSPLLLDRRVLVRRRLLPAARRERPGPTQGGHAPGDLRRHGRRHLHLRRRRCHRLRGLARRRIRIDHRRSQQQRHQRLLVRPGPHGERRHGHRRRPHLPGPALPVDRTPGTHLRRRAIVVGAAIERRPRQTSSHNNAPSTAAVLGEEEKKDKDKDTTEGPLDDLLVLAGPCLLSEKGPVLRGRHRRGRGVRRGLRVPGPQRERRRRRL
mmetsp:Transcript_36316/g.116353  ORF Transcript_36316/g.116353 Transcript_36316/m.116353 type:complete len:215 (-) Transcript_36316:45-689(-)